ncbi:uncharacterized protein B0I36DRAFT_257182, partial [Microdochium trichocladiopsis]
VREITASFRNGMRFQSAAIGTFQESTESFLIALFVDTNLCAIHARSATIQSACASTIPIRF